MPPFCSEKHENSQQKRFFNEHFGDFMGIMAQAVANPELSNQNHEYVQIILEQFVYEFNQKLLPKGVIFAKSQNSPSGWGQAPNPACGSQPCRNCNT